MTSNALPDDLRLVRVEPQPTYIESSGRWCWPLPERAHRPGCCTEVVTASREWWEYAPSEAKPHPFAEGVRLRDDVWYWAITGTADAVAKLEQVRKWFSHHHGPMSAAAYHELANIVGDPE